MKVEIGNATLYLGDCLEILPTLEGIDAVITDHFETSRRRIEAAHAQLALLPSEAETPRVAQQDLMGAA